MAADATTTPSGDTPTGPAGDTPVAPGTDAPTGPSGDAPVAPDGGSDTGAGVSGDGTGRGTGGGPGLGTEDEFAENPSDSGESVTTATRRELGALAGTLPFTGLILWAIAQPAPLSTHDVEAAGLDAELGDRLVADVVAIDLEGHRPSVDRSDGGLGDP